MTFLAFFELLAATALLVIAAAATSGVGWNGEQRRG